MSRHEFDRAELRDRPTGYAFGPQQPQLQQLLRSPQSTIPSLVRDYRARWRVPISGFIAISYTEGIDRTVTNFPDWPVLGVVAASLIMAGLFGGWLWALMWGGATHLAARALGGKKIWSDTARAIGYGLFWPGVFAATAGTGAALTSSGSGGAASLSLAFIVAQVSAGLWAVYTVIAALKAHHEFGWVRAAIAYALPFAVLFGTLLVFFLSAS